MNGKCFEIGTLQAFLDGETSPASSAEIGNHVAECDACAAALAQAEEESAFVFSALGREMDALVPTQRLWNRINESIEVEKRNAPFWQRTFGFFSAQLLSPSFATAFGALIVFGIVAAVWMTRPDSTTNMASTNITPPSSPVQKQPEAPVVDLATMGSDSVPSTAPSETASAPTFVKESKLSPEKLQRLVDETQRIRPQYTVHRPVQVPSYLPGEESYIKTIADLKQTVDGQKDVVLTPSSRVAYERDMAVVDDSIKKMKDVVRKNPRNQAAKQVLYSSYQDKIDLLNSVAQREELMASIQQ